MFELGDFNDNGTCDWLHYDWLEKYTVDSEQVDYMNDKFKDLKWRFKVGGYRHWGGAQSTGADFKTYVLNNIDKGGK